MNSKIKVESALMQDKIKLIYGILYSLRERREKRAESMSIKHKADEFIRLLYNARTELEVSTSNFNFCTDRDLMDYYIFRINAAERRLNYFLALGKTMPIYDKELVREIIGKISDETETLHWGRSF